MWREPGRVWREVWETVEVDRDGVRSRRRGGAGDHNGKGARGDCKGSAAGGEGQRDARIGVSAGNDTCDGVETGVQDAVQRVDEAG